MQTEERPIFSFEQDLTYYNFVRPAQLRFFHLFDKRNNRRHYKPVRLDQVEITLNSFYCLFLEFVQLLYLTSLSKTKLYLSRALVINEGEKIFYYQVGEEPSKGFIHIDNKDLWAQTVTWFWDQLRNVKITDLDRIVQDQQPNQERYNQMNEWLVVGDEGRDITKQKPKQTSANERLLDFLVSLDHLKISEALNLETKLRQISILSKIQNSNDNSLLLVIQKDYNQSLNQERRAFFWQPENVELSMEVSIFENTKVLVYAEHLIEILGDRKMLVDKDKKSKQKRKKINKKKNKKLDEDLPSLYNLQLCLNPRALEMIPVTQDGNPLEVTLNFSIQNQLVYVQIISTPISYSFNNDFVRIIHELDTEMKLRYLQGRIFNNGNQEQDAFVNLHQCWFIFEEVQYWQKVSLKERKIIKMEKYSNLSLVGMLEKHLVYWTVLNKIKRNIRQGNYMLQKWLEQFVSVLSFASCKYETFTHYFRSALNP